MAYRGSRRSQSDLTEIYLHGAAEFGRAQSEAYVRALREALDFLAVHLHAGRDRTELARPIRTHPHRAHVIVYRVSDDSSILVVRILHSRQDLPCRI